MAARASRRKSWFLGVVLALAPIAAFGEDVDGQINQLLEKIRQQDTASGNLTELSKLVDEALPLIMKAPPESLGRIRELSALIERKSALSRGEQAESAGGQARGRFERAEGRPVAMVPEHWVHARLKARIWRALDRQITEAGLPCQAVPNGMTIEIDEGMDYELVNPDALVNCGPPMPDDAVAAPNPVIVVEVLSHGTASRDAGGKLADYFRVASIQHYLLVRPNRREVIHHRRMGERIETGIVRKDTIVLDPPGLRLAIEEIYGP
jgi:Uma2 family endonuclease